MRARQLQQMLKFNADALTEMYGDYRNLRLTRKTLNEYGDDFMGMLNFLTEESARELAKQSADGRYAEVTEYTVKIKRLRKRIASMETIQVALKHELRGVASLEAFVAQDDEEWSQRAAMAREEGYVLAHWSGTGQEFLERFGDVVTDGVYDPATGKTTWFAREVK